VGGESFKSYPQKKKKTLGRGGEKIKLQKKTEISTDQGGERANKKSQPGMAEG
jgi:hypothetical protein